MRAEEIHSTELKTPGLGFCFQMASRCLWWYYGNMVNIVDGSSRIGPVVLPCLGTVMNSSTVDEHKD